jgi:Pentapeptide repeats (9 copies)
MTMCRFAWPASANLTIIASRLEHERIGVAMNRDETVDLFLKGKEAWNAWAHDMVAKRKAMEADGRWHENKEEWWKQARADFSRCLFFVRGAEETVKESKEAAEETKAGAAPIKSIPIDGTLLDFSESVFPSTAGFESATFTCYVDFGSATFTGDAYFPRTSFTGSARFARATFTGSARFARATFTGSADFECAIFTGYVYFNGTTFQNSTGFQKAQFQSEPRFTGIKVDRAFDMTGTEFAEVPAFNQADFKQAPDLDDVKIPLPGFWRGHNADLVATYRANRRMAIQGADYEREQMAFKGELRSRRWTVDKWGPALWLGIFYDGVADCGGSIVRPLSIWFASIFVFAAVYLRLSDGWTCGTPFIKALFSFGPKCAGAVQRRARRPDRASLSMPVRRQSGAGYPR